VLGQVHDGSHGPAVGMRHAKKWVQWGHRARRSTIEEKRREACPP
jgi:hypothetical protein